MESDQSIYVGGLRVRSPPDSVLRDSFSNEVTFEQKSKGH